MGRKPSKPGGALVMNNKPQKPTPTATPRRSTTPKTARASMRPTLPSDSTGNDEEEKSEAADEAPPPPPPPKPTPKQEPKADSEVIRDIPF